MATETFANLPSTTVSSGGTTAPASGTPETWTVASSASFPAAATGVTQFHVADTATATRTEMILVTNVSGTTWSVTRGAENTTPVAHTAGFTITQVVTAGVMGTLVQNPMTTAGDLVDGGAAGVPSRLAGPTAGAVPYALLSTPSGGVAQAPAWTQFDQTVSDLHPDGVAAAGATGKPVDAGHVHPLQAWQFQPESYGAKGDGKVIGDATIASGVPGTLTSATANFTSADTGKWIMVNGATGNNAVPLISQITFVNSTTVTLSVLATSAVTNASAIYGTDDTTAFNSCVTAAGNYAMSAFGPGKAQIMLGNKLYCLATSPTATGIFGSTVAFYSQIPLPYPNVNGSTQKLVIEFIGVGESDDNEYWLTTVPSLPGSCLVSMCLPPTLQSGTQPPSVIGGPSGSAGFSGGFANTKCYIDGVTVVIPFLGNQYAYDFSHLGGGGGGRFKATAFASVLGNYNQIGSLPGLGAPFTNSCGLAMPVTSNNDDCTVVSFTSEGCALGAIAQEHSTFLRLSSIYSYTGCLVTGSGAANHGVSIGYYTCEATNQALACNTNTQIPIFIGLMDTEVINTWDITDPNNGLNGVINWADYERTTMNVNGAANLQIFNTRSGATQLAGALIPKTSALTQVAGAVAINAALGNVFSITLTASGWAISNPTNPVDGQVIRLRLRQDATGSRTVTWGTAFDWGSVNGVANSAPALTTAANKTDVLGFEFNAANSSWMYLGVAFPQGF